MTRSGSRGLFATLMFLVIGTTGCPESQATPNRAETVAVDHQAEAVTKDYLSELRSQRAAALAAEKESKKLLVENLELKHAGEMKELEDKYKQEISTLKESHRTDLEALKEKHRQEVAELEAAHRQKNAELTATYEGQKATLEDAVSQWKTIAIVAGAGAAFLFIVAILIAAARRVSDH